MFNKTNLITILTHEMDHEDNMLELSIGMNAPSSCQDQEIENIDFLQSWIHELKSTSNEKLSIEILYDRLKFLDKYVNPLIIKNKKIFEYNEEQHLIDFIITVEEVLLKDLIMIKGIKDKNKIKKMERKYISGFGVWWD
jgi:hypothetical protein